MKGSKLPGTSPARAAILRPVASGLISEPSVPKPITFQRTHSRNPSEHPNRA